MNHQTPNKAMQATFPPPRRCGRNAAEHLRWATVEPRMGGEEIMTDAQRNLLFLELHKHIERVAQETAESLVGLREPATVTYPPNGGLTSDEAMSIRSHARDVESLGALRKLIADAVAAPVFHLCALLDGVSDPKDAEGEVMGCRVLTATASSTTRLMMDCRIASSGTCSKRAAARSGLRLGMDWRASIRRDAATQPIQTATRRRRCSSPTGRKK